MTPLLAPAAAPALADVLEAAGLTGRGGAAFPSAVKLRAAAEHGASLIVNVCDGELDAAKDAWVVEHHLPELVRGAELLARPGAGAAGGGGGAVRFAAHRGSPTAVRLRAAGLDVLEAPGRYVSSEETSLISLANSGLARPMTKRAPFVRGGRDSEGRRIPPTLVLNAETVWRAAQIAEYGPAWFRSSGLDLEPGPRLVTLAGAVAHPHTRETMAGVPLAELLDAAGAAVAPVLVGGLGGVFLSAREARQIRWCTADLARHGGSLGPGVVRVLDPGRCPLVVVDELLRYAAGESAGQCGPCMFGLPALASAWSAMAAAPSRASVTAVRERAGLLPGRGACRFPDGVAGLVRSALQVFDQHLTDHTAGRCRKEHRSP